MHRRRFLACAVEAATIGMVACRRESGRGLKVVAYPAMSMGGLYVAHESGYFADLGLDVEIQQMFQSAQTAPLLASGRLDAAFVILNPAIINAVARGAMLRIVAGREIASPTCGSAGTLYGRREAFPDGLTDLRKLKGKRVAAGARANVGEFYMDTLLATAGMSSDDVEYVSMPDPEMVAALVSGRVDAIVFSHVEKDLRRPDIIRGIGLAQVHPNLQFSFIFFGPSLLTGDPEISVKFLTAYLRGARDFVAGKTPKYLEEMARATGRNPSFVQEACRTIITEDGSIDFVSVERCIEWAVKRGYSPATVKAAQLVETRFLDEIRKRNLMKGTG